MSDLDADLYGDLYGDDNEFAVPIEEAKEAKSQVEQTEKTTSPAAAATPTTSVAPQDEDSTPATNAEKNDESPIPSFGNGNVPQPIQSYQSSTQDYSTRIDHGFRSQPQVDTSQSTQASLPVVDRHVRPSEMKDEGKMFIGGLNWDTTDEGLKKYFEQFGKVEACTIMRDATGRSRCFAFLTFEEPASVNAVMVREHVLDGKIIDPKRAIPRQEHQRAQKLFIGGLAGTVTSESMREYFSQYGKVIDSTVMLDRETGRSKGFGFVSFENTNVDPILGFGKLEIDGKMIDVKLAQPRHQRDGGGEGGGGGGYSRGGAYGGGQSDGYSSGTGGSFGGSQAVLGGAAPAAVGATGGSGTPFDPQALAQLYTRMFQQFGGAAGMGGMGSMMGGGGMGMGAMGMGGGAPNMGRMGGAGMGGGAGMMGMGASPMAMGPMSSRGGMAGGGGGMMGSSPMNAPRGPRGSPAGPQGGLGPQRTQRGHNYHPYSR